MSGHLAVYSHLVMNYVVLIFCFVIITGELITVFIMPVLYMIPSAECTCYNYIAFFRSFVYSDIGAKLYEICCCIVLSVITMLSLSLPLVTELRHKNCPKICREPAYLGTVARKGVSLSHAASYRVSTADKLAGA